MNLETKWLEDFIALAATRSFSQAADKRFVTQPAFSRRIRSLEAMLGLTLVDRSCTPIELTATEYSSTLGLPQLMAYWTRYGDETGQFATNPPRAVLRVATGATEEVVVRLRNGSSEGSTLRFEAEIITSPRVWGVLEKKVDQVDETAAQVEHSVPAPSAE